MVVRGHCGSGDGPAGGGIASSGRAAAATDRTLGEDDRAYWSRREREARALAAGAGDEGVARIHLALAEQYAARASGDRPSRDRDGAA